MLPYLCIPLLPLIAVLLILVSPPAKVHARAKLAILPMAAAFVLSILALGMVVAGGSQVMRGIPVEVMEDPPGAAMDDHAQIPWFLLDPGLTVEWRHRALFEAS